MMSFQEFLDTAVIDEEAKQTLTVLSEAHPIIRNHSVVQAVLKNKSARLPLSQVVQINERIMQYSTQLARQAAVEPPEARLLIICELSVLSTAASVLSALIAAKLQSSVDRLSKIAQTNQRK